MVLIFRYDFRPVDNMKSLSEKLTGTLTRRNPMKAIPAEMRRRIWQDRDSGMSEHKAADRVISLFHKREWPGVSCIAKTKRVCVCNPCKGKNTVTVFIKQKTVHPTTTCTTSPHGPSSPFLFCQRMTQEKKWG
jgi:hypothetical protein